MLAEGAGIDPVMAYDVLQNSAVGAPFVRYKRAAFLEADQPVAMSLDLVAKDFRLIAELAAGQAQGGAGERRRAASWRPRWPPATAQETWPTCAPTSPGSPRWTAEPTRGGPVQ